MLFKYNIADISQRILCGGKLNEDIAAVAVIVEHIFYPAELTDYPAEPVLKSFYCIVAPRRRLMPTAFAAFIPVSILSSPASVFSPIIYPHGVFVNTAFILFYPNRAKANKKEPPISEQLPKNLIF